MEKNIENLRLPSYSDNLGEIIFYLFKGKLEEYKGKGPIILEGELDKGKEKKLELILKKQVYVWEKEKPIDKEFYKNQ